MRLQTLLPGLILTVVGFGMAKAVDSGFTQGWSSVARGSWVVGILGGVLGGIILSLNGLGLLTDEVLRTPIGSSSDQRATSRPLGWKGFIGIYVAMLAIAIVSAIAFDAWFGIEPLRTGLGIGALGYLLAATGRPWWLYYTLRRIRWFAFINTDRHMRILLVVLGLALAIAAIALPDDAAQMNP